MKKLLTCLLMLTLVLGLFAGCSGDDEETTPADGGADQSTEAPEDGGDAAGDEADLELATDTVTVRVEGYDSSLVPGVSIPITEPFSLVEDGYADLEPEEYTALHAIVTVLETHDLEFSASGGYLGWIEAGIDTGAHGDWAGWMFSYNGEAPSVAADQITVSDGDEIILYYCPFFEEGAYHAYFSDYAAACPADGEVTLTLIAANVGDFMAEDINVYGPCGGAAILIDGEETEYATDESGQVTLSFAGAGTYTVTAVRYGESGENLLTYAPCVVTVG